MPTTSTAAPITQEAAVVPDFYFTCSTLNCTLRASSCARNRKESSKVQSLMIIKGSARCKGCKNFENEQASTPISIEVYHAQVMSDSAAQPKAGYDHNQPKPGIHSLWEGRGRSKTRVS
jgi:hypothetical protein